MHKVDLHLFTWSGTAWIKSTKHSLSNYETARAFGTLRNIQRRKASHGHQVTLEEAIASQSGN